MKIKPFCVKSSDLSDEELNMMLSMCVELGAYEFEWIKGFNKPDDKSCDRQRYTYWGIDNVYDTNTSDLADNYGGNLLSKEEAFEMLGLPQTPSNTAEKWDFIVNHPELCNEIGSSPIIESIPVMVNPDTGTIELENNTKLEWWIEVMVCDPTFNPIEDPSHLEHFHDYRLDCGGSTMEEAVSELYKLVIKYYGDYDYV